MRTEASDVRDMASAGYDPEDELGVGFKDLSKTTDAEGNPDFEDLTYGEAKLMPGLSAGVEMNGQQIARDQRQFWFGFLKHVNSVRAQEGKSKVSVKNFPNTFKAWEKKGAIYDTMKQDSEGELAAKLKMFNALQKANETAPEKYLQENMDELRPQIEKLQRIIGKNTTAANT